MMASIDTIEQIDDDKIHDFKVIDNGLIIKPAFKYFPVDERGNKHGCLVVDHGQITLEGCNFPKEEFEEIKKHFVVVKS